MYHQYNTSTREYDEDVENLKNLINKLKQKKQIIGVDEASARQIVRLQQQNKDYAFKIDNLTRQNKQLIRQLLAERQDNSRLKTMIEDIRSNNISNFKKEYSNSQFKATENLTPDKRYQYTSPTKLNNVNQGSSNRDQLYRLNSYLIQYNTNIKLLVEKYNYLIKLRGLNFGSDTEEWKIINQANQIFNNRKPIQQAKVLLRSSRKKYLDSESSSEIEQQLNQIDEGL